MVVVAFPICNSFQDRNCKKRLEYYVEIERDEKKLILEKVPCPFYENKKCKLSKGTIGFYMVGYDHKDTYVKQGNELEKLEKPWTLDIISL